MARTYFLVLIGLTAACSSTTNIVQANCGPGTTLQDGQCVSDQDASLLDIGFPGDVDPLDAAVDTLTDTRDAGDSTVSDAASLDEPCPALSATETFYESTHECVKSALTCDLEAVGPWYPKTVVSRVWLRTPANPGVGADTHCTSCGESGVYGLSIEIDRSSDGSTLKGKWVRVKVGDPYTISTDAPCWHSPATGTDATAHCVVIDTTYLNARFSALTRNPAAPARNVSVEFVGPGATCP